MSSNELNLTITKKLAHGCIQGRLKKDGEACICFSVGGQTAQFNLDDAMEIQRSIEGIVKELEGLYEQHKIHG